MTIRWSATISVGPEEDHTVSWLRIRVGRGKNWIGRSRFGFRDRRNGHGMRDTRL